MKTSGLRAAVIALSLLMFFSKDVEACTVSAGLVTDPVRGYGLSAKASGGFTAGTISYWPVGREHLATHLREWEATVPSPINVFQPLICTLRPGEYEYVTSVSCWNNDTDAVEARDRGTFTIPDASDTLAARVLEPPRSTGNVEVTYRVDATWGLTALRVAGTSIVHAVSGTGTMILDLPPGTHAIVLQACKRRLWGAAGDAGGAGRGDPRRRGPEPDRA